MYEFVDGIPVTADNLKNERTVLESEIVIQMILNQITDL